jgi:hypothetical protein
VKGKNNETAQYLVPSAFFLLPLSENQIISSAFEKRELKEGNSDESKR